MRIRFRQSGGVAGIAKGVDLDVAALSPDEAAVVQQALPRLRAGSGPASSGPPALQRDVRQIVIELDEGVATTRWVFDERNVSPELKPLVELLAAKAQYLKR